MVPSVTQAAGGAADARPVEWLREYCSPELDTAALADRLAMTGTEVERVEHYGVDALEQFVVGRVLDAEQHPDADRLRVCTVDVGEGEPSQIVCGAPNVAAGQTVAVAKPGAVMPDGTKLKVAKLRGQASHGMILAEDEVGIGTEHDGIMVLDRDGLTPGAPLRRGAADRHRRARARDHPEPARLPRGLRRRPRGPRRHRRAAGAAAVGRGPGARPVSSMPSRSPSRTPSCARGSPRGRSRTCTSGPHRAG